MNDITQTKIIFGFEFNLVESFFSHNEEYFEYFPNNKLFVIMKNSIGEIRSIEYIYNRGYFFEMIVYILTSGNNVYGYSEQNLQLDNIFDSFTKAKKALLLK